MLRLLEERFGPIDEAHRAKVLIAEQARLETWFDRALEAKDIETVFF